MKQRHTGTAIALVFAFGATTQSWTGARGQGVPVSNAPPVVAANANTRIDVTQSGTPIVNIATPREDGTSYNVFSKLNVGKEGLIFNNSKEIGKSQIGGQILANSRLKNSGEASLILNEVTGGTRSDLRGALEVFGGRASLVIANPSGITCDGCGFINVARAALSTGKITFGASGEFTGFAVDGGDVRVEGQGLLAGNVDFFDIVTGSAVINANLFARDLVISGGNADFDFASRTATARGTGNNRLAIDSSLLGGMYANRIRLIGTGAGVGINLQGLVNALEGPLAISADGAITVKSAAAASDVSIASKANVNIDERVYGGGATRIDAGGNIVLAGDFVGAANNLSLNSGGDIRLGGTGLYAGLSSAGRFDSAGTLTISAAGSLETRGVRAIASEGLNLSANSATLGKDSAFSARNISVKIAKSLISDASVEATGSLDFSGDTLALGGALVANDTLAINGRSALLSGRAIGLASLRVATREALNISGEGDLQSGGVAALAGATINNAGRVLGMAGSVVDAVAGLTNSGAILSGGDVGVTSGGDAQLGGIVNANGKTTVSAVGKATLTGTVAAAGDVALKAASAALEGTLSSGANLSVTADGALTTGAASVIVADGATALLAKALDASGTISSGGTLDLRATDALALAGQTNAGGALSAKASDITLGGVTVSDGDITLTSSGALRATGAVSAGGALVAKATAITSAAGAQLVAGDALSLTSAGDLTNAGVISGKTANLSSAAALTNIGTLFGADALDLTAKTTLTQAGTAESGKALNIAADALTLSGKTLGMDGVSATARTISANGNLQSGATLSLAASETLDTAGDILSVGALSATSGAGFVQAANILLGKGAKFAAIGSFTQNGTIAAAGTIDLSGASILGSGALSSDANVSVRALLASIDLTGDISAKSGILFAAAGALSLGGNVATDDRIDISATDLSIAGDVVASSGVLTQITGGVTLANTGRLRSGTGLDLSVARLINAGLIESAGALTLKTAADLTNSGALTSADGLTLRVGGDLSTVGRVAAGTALSATVAGRAALDGTTTAAGDLALLANTIAVGATLASGGNLDLSSSDALSIGAGGTVSAQKAAKLSGNSLTNDGTVVGGDALTLSASDTLTTSGSIDSGGALNLTGNSLALGGDISGLGGIDAKADGALVLSGALSSDKTTVLEGASLTSSAGSSLVGAGAISLTSTGAVALDGTLASDAAVVVRGAGISTAAGSRQSARTTLTLDSRAGLSLSGTATSSGDTQLSAIGDANLLAGSVRAGGAVDLSAANVNASARIETNSTATILANIGSVRIGGTVLAAQDLNLSAATALDVSGTVQADKALVLGGDSITLTGSAIGVDALSINASRDFTTSNSLATNGALRVEAGNISLGGTVDVGGLAEVRARDTLSLTGTLFGNKTLNIAANALDLSGTVQSLGALSINTLRRTDIAGAARLLSGDTLLLNGGRSIAALGTVASKASGTFNAADSITISDRLDSGGALDFSAQTLSLGGVIASDASVSATATGALSLAGTLSAKGAVALAGADVRLSGSLLTQDNALITAADALDISGTVAADKRVDLSARDLTVTKQVIAKTGLAANATTITVGANGDLQSGGALSLNAAQALTLDGKLLALDALTLVSTTRLDLGGTIQSGANATLSTDGALELRGSLTASGDISARATNANLSGLASSGGTLAVNAADTLITGRLAANTAIAVTATGSATLGSRSSLESEGSVSVTGAGISANGTLLSGTTLLLDASTALTQAGRVEARDAITFTSLGSLSNSGTVLTLGTVSVRGGETDLGSDIQGKNVSVRADALRVRGKLSAGDTLDLIAANALTTDATAALASGAAFGISAGTSATLGGKIDAGTALTVWAGDTLTLSGTVQSGADAQLSGRVIALDGSLAADKSVSVNAVDALTIAGSLSGIDGLTARGSSVDVGTLAALRTNQNLSLTSDSRLTNAGDISALGAVSVSAGAALTNSKNISGTTLALEGGNVSLEQTSTLASTGALSLTSRDSLSIAGTIDTDNTLTLRAGSTLDQGGALRAAGATTITAGGAFTGSGSIETADTLSLTAASLTGSGAMTADGQATLTSTTGDISLGGALASAAGITLGSAGDIVLLSRAITDGTLSLSGRDINLSNLAIGRDGASVNATRAVQLFGTAILSSDKRIDVTGATLTNDGVISAKDSVSASVSGNLINRNDILTDGVLTLRGADIISGGALGAGTALDIDGSGTVSLGGTLSAGTTLDVASGQLSINGTLDAGAALTLGSRGDITLGATSSLVSEADLTVRTAANLLASGTSFSGGTTLLRGTTGLTLSNDLQSVGAVTLEGGTLTLGGTLATDGSLTATTLGATRLTGDYNAAKAISLTSGATDFASGSRLISGDAITLTADSLTSAATISATKALSLTATTDLLSSGTLSAGGALSLDARGTLTQSGVVDSANLLTLKGGSVTLANTAIGVTGINVEGGTIALTGTADLRSGADLTLNSRSAITTAGRLSARSNVLVSAATNIAQGASLVSGGAVTLDAVGGTLTNSGTIDAALAVTLAGNTLTNSAEVASETQVTLTNRAGTASLGGTVSGKTGVSLTSAGDVGVSGSLVSGTTLGANVTGTLTSTDSGEILADGAIDLSATTAISNAGIISSADALTFNTPIFSSIGALESGKAFALSAQSITLAGRVASTDSITLAATDGALDLGASLQGTNITLSSLGGDLLIRSGKTIDATGAASLTSNRSISVGGLVTGNAGVSVTTTGGDISFASGVRSATAGVTVSASGAVTNAGALTAKTGVTLSGSSITSGSVSADGAVALNASGAINVTDIIDSSTSVSLTSTAGAVNVAALSGVLSGGSITLSAATNITNAGDLSAETSLDAVAAGTLTNEATGFIFSRLGRTLLGGNRLSLGGDVYSATSLLLNANDISIGGSVGANNAFGLTTGSLSILSGGLLQSNSAITLTLGTGQIDGTLRALGSLDLSAATLGVGNLGLIEANGALNANVTGTLDNRGQIAVAGPAATLTLAAGTLNNSNLISASGNITSSGGALTNSGTIESGGALTITNSDTIVSDGARLEALGALSVNSATLTSAGTIAAGGALSLTGRNTLDVNGAVFSNLGSVSLTSNGLARVAASIDAATTATITGGQVQLSGDVVAGGAVAVTANSGALDITSNIDSGNAITLTANNGDLTLGAGKTLFGATGISANARSIAVSSDLLSPGAIALTAQNSLTTSGNLLSNDAARLTAGTALTLNGSIDAASASLSAANLTTRGSVDVSGAVTLSATNGASIEGRISAGGPISFSAPGRVNLDVTRTGRLISGNAITLQNVANLSVSGLVSAATNVNADYLGTATILGRVEAGNNITLTNNGTGATSVGGVLAAGDDIVINGGTLNIATGGLAYAGRDFSFSTGSFDGGFNSLTVDGTLAAGRNVALSLAGGLNVARTGLIAADGSITSTSSFAGIAGDIAAGTALNNGTLTITTRGDNGAPTTDFSLTGSLQSVGALSVSAARDITIATGSRIISDSSVALSGQNITALGTIGAGDLVSINSSGSILHGGLIQSGRRIAVNAGGTVTLQNDSRIETAGNAASIGFRRDAGDDANIDVRAGGSISASGILVSDGAIALKSAASNITNSGTGTITGASAVVLQADNGSVTNSGTITGSNLALYQGVDFINTGSFTAAGNLLLSAPSITNSGLLGSSGSLILLTPGALTNQDRGTIFAGGALGIEARGGITNDLSTILALGDIGLTAPSLLNNSARIESLSGSVTIQAANVVNQIKNLSITPGGPASPSGLFGNDGTRLFGSESFDITTCSGGGFSYRCFGDRVDVTVTMGIFIGTFTYRPATAGGDDTVTTNSGASTIIAAGDVTITTGSNAVGTVTNSNSSILAGGDIKITAGTLNNIATLVRTTRVEGLDNVVTICLQAGQNGGCSEPETLTVGEARELGFISLPNCSPLRTSNCLISGSLDVTSVTSNNPLPTLINARGTVMLTVGTLNNEQPTLNGQPFTLNPNGTPGVTLTDANPVGRRDSFIDPNAPSDRVTGTLTGADPANGGQAAQTTGIAVNVVGGGLLNNSNSTGDGAGTIGRATAAMVGAGGDLLDADAAGAANSGGVSGADNANQRGAITNVTLADGSAATGIAADANGGGANGAASVKPSRPGALDVNAPNSGGGKGVGTTTGTPGGFVNSLINAITGGGGPNTNGAGVGTVSGVTTAGIDAATLVGGVQTASITGVDAVDPNATATADLIAAAAQSARLVDGFGGLAIPGILGAGGQAGSFVFDFLAQFGLTAGANGFGLAGGGSLFTFNNNPDSQFLFTTNPGFASTADLFDSNFFFEGLGIDRSTRFTRLGDGFFEAQLISKQIQAATGQAQLGSFGDAFAQARGLLQAGLAEAKRLQLSVGVALTATQVADLKTSLVWYVKSTVQGREVLVPVVYLAASDQKSIKNGAIISGANVVASVSGSITNNGTISASRVVSLTAGGDIVNQAGGRINGGTVIASAARDILAQGGSSISGGNILLSAGRDISLTATTNTTSTSERKDFGKKGFTQSSSTTQTVTGAELAATGTLVVSAGRDLTLSAAKVSAGGDASLSAGRDVTITGVTTTDTSETASRTVKKGFLSKKVTTTSSSTSTDTFNGTSITTGGNLSVAAGNQLAVKGSDIASGGNATLTGVNGVSITSALENSSASSSATAKRKSSSTSETASTNRLTTITAGGTLGVGSTAGTVAIAGADLSATGTTTLVGQSVTVTGVIDSATFTANSRTVKKGLASKKVTTTANSSDTQAVVASTVSGDRVNVVATNGDVTVRGANIVSDNGTLVQATGAVTIGTLEARSSESQSVKVKKSGLSLSGAGLFAGVAKSTNASTLETVTNTGSLVGSANGDVTVSAGKALTITGSSVAAPGTVNLIGESVRIENATDTANSTSLSKSSSFGVSIKAQSNIVDAVKTTARLAEIGTTTSNARVAAVSAVAGGLAVSNGVDAAKDVAKTLKDKKGSLGVTVSASLGFSKSKSTSASTDQTIIASSVSGGDVNIIATGAGAAGSIKVIGSDVTATNNLTVLGNGPITFASAQETDTTSGKSSSFGVSLGVSAGVGLSAPGADGAGGGKLGFQAPSVNFGVNGSKSSFSGTDVTNREATLSAGGTATIGTPGALTLDGAILSGKRVEIDAGSLTIASRQDTSTFASKDKSAGVNVSVTFAGQVSASGNLSVGKQSGDFASVETQAGIRAGEDGFGIRVAGATDLKGAVIASTADAARNQLTTGTLTASALENRETFKATSTSIGAGIGANLGKDRQGTINTDQSGNKLPGIKTDIGTISATPPAALSASGSQSSTTVSAIAQGGITVTSGDTASLGVAQSISRDTSGANDALTKQFTESKRADINQGFEATRQLVSEVGTFFANRGREEADLRKAADDAKARGDTTEETRLRAEAKKINDTFGSGSAIRIAATAFTAAAGSNVTGGLGSFAQAAAVNVLQSLAASKVKDIADNIQGDRQTQESVRAALQAVVGCAGSVAGGNGGCGDAAIGAAASVVINNLITSASITPRDTNGDGVIDPLTTEEQQARVNIVTTLIAALATGAGLDTQIATTAATIETENNKTRNFRLANGAVARIADAGEGLTVAQLVRRYGIDNHPDLLAISQAYGTRDTAELQAIVNLIADGQSGTEIRAARAAASEAFGQGTAEARAAFVDIGNGRTTTAEVQARADANRVTVSSSSGIFNNNLLNIGLFGSNPFLTCLTCTIDAQGNIRIPTAEELLAGGRRLLNNLGEGIATFDANNGRIVTRGLGVLQAGAGLFDIVAGGTTAIVAGAACPVTGVSCVVSAGGGAVVFIGGDNVQAGIRTAFSGEYTPTFGANRISDLTGISVENADLLYGFSTFGIGTAQGAIRRFTLRGVADAEADAALAAARAEAARIGDSLAARADAEAGLNNNAVNNLQNLGPADLSFQRILNGIGSLNVSTRANEAVFYSGRGAREAAESHAVANGLTTLEQTAGGGYLDQLGLFQGSVNGVGRSEAREAFARLSANYASQASGRVTAIINNPAADSIFLTQELPALLRNPNVSAITVRSVSGSSVTIPRGSSLARALRLIRGF